MPIEWFTLFVHVLAATRWTTFVMTLSLPLSQGVSLGSSPRGKNKSLRQRDGPGATIHNHIYSGRGVLRRP
jgi:hypothetical protein